MPTRLDCREDNKSATGSAEQTQESLHGQEVLPAQQIVAMPAALAQYFNPIG
jgi:hypothetical protein